MQSLNFEEAVRRIVAADERYEADAYHFVQEAIRHTQKTLGRTKTDESHVGARELLNGMRDYALNLYGPMTLTVLSEWGVRSCEDFGELVYNLIQYKQATQSPSDSREDFKDGYGFEETFRKPFLPLQRSASKTVPAKMIGQD